MSNLNQSKLGKFLSSKGFYIALAVCIVGAGAAAWVAIDATMDSLSTQDEKKLENSPPISSASSVAGNSPDWGFSSLNEVERKVEDVEVKKGNAPASSKPESPSTSSSPSSVPSNASVSSQPVEDAISPSPDQEVFRKQPAQPSLAYSLPILSEVFNPYSNGELVKNKTLGDWRTHDGIDLKAAKGADVMVCADGKVARVYDDALWGACVEIEHAGGLTSVYCGLDKASITVKEGDDVKVKGVLGKVDKVPCEISLDTHLHFALKKDGKWADPVSTMGLN